MADTLTPYLNMLAWAVVPQLVSSVLQRVWYSYSYRVDSLKPQPGSLKYRLHYNRIYVLVVGLYLLYTIYEANANLKPNYYQLLNLDPRTITTQHLRKAWKQFSIAYHPDKNSSPQAEAIFIVLTRAYETLSDPVKRQAYERFGPSVEGWGNHVVTARDYTLVGVRDAASFYAGTGLVLIIFNILGKAQFAKYWRFVAFFSLACVEFSMLLAPKPLPISRLFVGYRLVYQQITILHQVFTTIFIALNQVGPILSHDSTKDVRAALQRLQIVTKIASDETTAIVRESFAPFSHDETAQPLLKRKMGKIAVDLRMLTDSGFSKVYSRVYQRIVGKKSI